MDPLSILGAVGSAGSIIDLLAKTITLADRWYHSYREARDEVQLLRWELLLVQHTINMIGGILSRSNEGATPLNPEFQQPGFVHALLGAQMVLQQIFAECSVIESRFKHSVSGKLAWALSDRRRVERLRENLETIQSSLSSFLNVQSFAVLLVAQDNSKKEAEKYRADMHQLLIAVQGDLKRESEGQTQTTFLRLRDTNRRHRPRLIRKLLAASVQWQRKYGCSFRLSGIAGDDEPASIYNFSLFVTFPTGLFGDKHLKISLSLGIGKPWYEQTDILGGGIRTRNAIPYSAEVIGAAHTGNVTLLKMLLMRGRASIGDETPDMRPLLWHAVDGESLEAVEFLLNSKADVTALTGPYQTELLSRAFYRRNAAISRLLLRHGVDFDHINTSGTTPAHHLFNHGRTSDSKEFLEMLTANGFTSLNVQDEFGATALHRAAHHGTPDDVERLVRLGADYQLRTPSDGFTPMFSAIFNDNSETLRKLVIAIQEREKNVPPREVVSDVDARGWTPLHVAVDKGRFSAVKELLGLGADPFNLSIPLVGEQFCEDMTGRRVSPVDLARHKGRDALERLERLMREAGKYDTYLDDEGDLFWPTSVGYEEKAGAHGCYEACNVEGATTGVSCLRCCGARK